MTNPRRNDVFSCRAMRLILRKSLMVLLSMFFALSQADATGKLSTTHPALSETRKEAVVYITKTGKKYHRSSCRYLSNSKLEVSLKDAKKNGYEACKVCKP